MYGAYGQAPAAHHQQQQQQQRHQPHQPPQYAAAPQQQQQQQGSQYQYPPQQQRQVQQMTAAAPSSSVPPAPAVAAAAAIVEPERQQQQMQQQTQHQPPTTIYVDTQHDDMVHDARLDYYGTKLATGSSDRTIKVYDVSGDSYSPNATLTGHTGPIYQLSWSHPKFGPVLASASFDSSVLIHREVRPGEWTLVKAFVGIHDSSVNSVEFAPHEYGLVACAASSDGRVSVMTHDATDDSWTVEYLRDTPLGVNSASWAPYSVVVGGGGEGGGATSSSSPSPPRIATGGSDNGIRVWRRNATSGTWEQEAFDSSVPGVGHTDWVRDVAWAPGVVPGTSVVASCSEDRTVIVWKQGVVADAVDDGGAGEEGGEGEGGGGGGGGDGSGGKWTPTLLNTFDDPVWRVSWSITGNILAVSSGDSNVTLWKEALDGSWSQVSRVEDVAATGGKGAD